MSQGPQACLLGILENIYRSPKLVFLNTIIFELSMTTNLALSTLKNLILYKGTISLPVLIIFNSLQQVSSFVRLGFYSFRHTSLS